MTTPRESPGMMVTAEEVKKLQGAAERHGECVWPSSVVKRMAATIAEMQKVIEWYAEQVEPFASEMKIKRASDFLLRFNGGGNG